MVKNGQRNFTEKGKSGRINDIKVGLHMPKAYAVFHRITGSTESEGTHEDHRVQLLAWHRTPQEPHHVISVSFSQKAIPVLEGRTRAEERTCTFQKKTQNNKKPNLKSSRKIVFSRRNLFPLRGKKKATD